MLKKIFSSFAFVFYVSTVLAQKNAEQTMINQDSYRNSGLKHSELKPFFIIQGTINKFASDADARFGTSASLGLKYLNKFGVAVNAQLYGLDYGVIDFVPLSMELSYSAERHRLRPFANLQMGHTFSNSGFSYLLGDQKINSKTRGTAFLSPGIGVLIAVKKQTGVLLTLSYVRSGFASNTTATSPGGTATILSKDNFSGYRLGLGFKF